MSALRRQVERVVRPVQASAWRKNRMREELLAHLARLYDEELARNGGDERQAVAAACERFGDPASLSAELQATVPRPEHWGFAPLPGSSWGQRRPGESIQSHMRRVIGPLMASNALVWTCLLAFIAVLSWQRPGRENHFGGLVMLALAYQLIFPFFLVVPQLLCDRLRQAWKILPDLAGAARRRAQLSIAALTGVTMLVMAGSMGLLLALVNFCLGIELFPAELMGWVVLGSAVISLPVTMIQTRQLDDFEQWGSLDLDGEAAV